MILPLSVPCDRPLRSPRFPALIITISEPAAAAGVSFRRRSRNMAYAEATQNNGRPNGPPE
jgi:hypothetical protein